MPLLLERRPGRLLLENGGRLLPETGDGLAVEEVEEVEALLLESGGLLLAEDDTPAGGWVSVEDGGRLLAEDGSGLTVEAAEATVRWSDLYPTGDPAGEVHFNESVIIDRDITINGLMVHHHEGTPLPVLEFDPTRSVLVQSSGSIAVEDGATLRMRPSGPDVVHEIRFVGVDESLFVGGGGANGAPMSHADYPDDVGLWVHGTLDLVGHERNSWTRATGAVTAGATAVTVEDATGWRAGDLVTICPTGDPTADSGHYLRYDERTVTAVTPGAGTQATLTLSSAATYDHPAPTFDGYYDGGDAEFEFPPEVLNLTRNVVIGGTSTGRSHMMVHASTAIDPLRLENVKLPWMGPQVFEDPETQLLSTGRYPFHFHFADDTRTGSTLRNILVVDSGLKAFITHATHDIIWDRCVAHRVYHVPYWWDMKLGPLPSDPLGPPTDRVAYLGCVASMIIPFPSYRGFAGHTGFALGHGEGNRCVDCVAVGVQGAQTSSGFTWPSAVNLVPHNVWDFHDCVAHNCRHLGVYVWQNDNHQHVIADSQFWRNGDSGILHGAYVNIYRFEDVTCWGNAWSGVDHHAEPADEGPIVMDRVWMDGGGTGTYALSIARHVGDPNEPVQYLDCRFRGYTDAAIAVVPGPSGPINPDIFYFRDPIFDGPEATWFWLGSDMHEDGVLDVEFTGGDHYELHRYDWPTGTYVADWNAMRVDL